MPLWVINISVLIDCSCLLLFFVLYQNSATQRILLEEIGSKEYKPEVAIININIGHAHIVLDMLISKLRTTVNSLNLSYILINLSFDTNAG